MGEEDYTERYVTPIRVGVGHARRQGAVLLRIVYKLSPDQPEEYEQRYMMSPTQATAIAHDLLAMVQDLSA